MMDYMKRQMRPMLAVLRNTVIADTANWKTRIMLRDAMVEQGIPGDIADTMALVMQVKVADEIFADAEFMAEAVGATAAFAANMYRQIGRDFTVNRPDVMKTIAATQFTFEFA